MQKTGLRGARFSLQQERLWGFLQESHNYRVQASIALTGHLDEQAFQHALHSMLERHEILQTVFYSLPGMDTPLQVIGQCQQVYCPVINLETFCCAEQDVLLDQHFTTAQMQSFDLAHGPLLRTMLFRLSSSSHVFLMALPALCADASTLTLLITEIVHSYQTSIQRGEMTEDALQYTAVTAWQQKLLASDNAKTPQEYWSRVDLLQRIQTQLPFAVPEAIAGSNANASFVISQTSFALDDSLSEQIHTMARRYNVSPSSILLTCWYILLFRLTNVPEQLIGVSGDGRVYEEFRDTPGLYARFVPVDIYMDRHMTFVRLLNTIHLSSQEAMKWQLYFTWPALESSAPGRERGCYLPVQFEYENWPARISSEKLTVSLSRRFCCTEPFDLKLSALQIGSCFHIDISYNSCAIDATYAAQLSSILVTLLHNSIAQPEKPVSLLQILPHHEQERLIMAFRGVVRSYSSSITSIFEEQVVRTPDLIAVVGMTEEITYREVNKHANQLARVLRHHGVGSNVLVGLRVPRSARMLVSILAILKAGGAYLPLDSEIPSARLEYQLRNAQVPLLLTEQSLLNEVPAWGGEILCLDSMQEAVAQELDTNLPITCEAGDLAYVIYTSGSTGAPKGVLIQQQSVTNYALALCDLLGCKPGWQFATVSTIAADLGNTAIFCALLSGGAVQVLDYETVTSSAAFMKWSTFHPIDVLKIVPSHLSALLADDKLVSSILPRRALIMGGEVLPSELVAHVQEYAGDCAIYNHYGPTETTIGVLVNVLKAAHVGEQEWKVSGAQKGVPLGNTIANMEVYVLDRQQQVVPVGVAGELYIGGPGVAPGYLQQSKQTAARFVPHPFSQQPGNRLYRTGDIVKYTRQNQIAFVARDDRQIKLHGYRIELGEIESALGRHPQIHNAVVLLHDDGPAGPYLVAFVTARQHSGPSSDALKAFVSTYLPAYMVPSKFVYLKTLPLTANGKIDRQQLLSLAKSDSVQSSSASDADSPPETYVLPRDVIELQLSQIWEEILQRQRISVTDNFFDLGGHSILAVRLIAHILREFGQDLPLSAIFLHPTIASLATVLRQQDNSKNQSPLVAIQPQGTNPPLFLVHPSGGIASNFLPLARYLTPDQPLYGLQTTGIVGTEDNISSIEDLATHYVLSIQAIQPQGPYFLGGWSMGGVVALEMARQLLLQGHKIALLAIIDSRLADADMRDRAAKESRELTDEGFARMMVFNLKINLPDDFQHVEREKRVDYILELAKKINGIPEEADLEQVRRVFRVEKEHTRLAHLYIPASYPCHIDYFVAQPSPQHSQTVEERESAVEGYVEPKYLRPWREVAAGGITVHAIKGEHRAMLEEPGVQVFSAKLRQCIDTALDGLL